MRFPVLQKALQVGGRASKEARWLPVCHVDNGLALHGIVVNVHHLKLPGLSNMFSSAVTLRVKWEESAFCNGAKLPCQHNKYPHNYLNSRAAWYDGSPCRQSDLLLHSWLQAHVLLLSSGRARHTHLQTTTPDSAHHVLADYPSSKARAHLEVKESGIYKCYAQHRYNFGVPLQNPALHLRVPCDNLLATAHDKNEHSQLMTDSIVNRFASASFNFRMSDTQSWGDAASLDNRQQ